MPYRATIAEGSSDTNMTWAILIAVGGAVVTGAGILWKSLESRHAKHTAALEARIETLEGIVKKMQEQHAAELKDREKQMSSLRHERVALLSALSVAEAHLGSLIRHAKLKPLTPEAIEAIVGDPNDSHFGNALAEHYANNALKNPPQ